MSDINNICEKVKSFCFNTIKNFVGVICLLNEWMNEKNTIKKRQPECMHLYWKNYIMMTHSCFENYMFYSKRRKTTFNNLIFGVKKCKIDFMKKIK